MVPFLNFYEIQPALRIIARVKNITKKKLINIPLKKGLSKIIPFFLPLRYPASAENNCE